MGSGSEVQQSADSHREHNYVYFYQAVEGRVRRRRRSEVGLHRSADSDGEQTCISVRLSGAG